MRGKFKKEYWIIKRSKLFDEKFYLINNPDVRKADVDPLEHFILHGWKEGRNPNSWFDVKEYISKNPEILKLNMNPLIHYIYRNKDKKNDVEEVGLEEIIVRPQEKFSSLFYQIVSPRESQRLRGLRVVIVTPDIVGPVKTGGIGTAFYELALFLRKEGAEVTILYSLPQYCETGSFDFWKKQYASLGIRLEAPDLSSIIYVGTPIVRQISYNLDLWLREKEGFFDVIIFPEWQGLLYYTLCAKRNGLRYLEIPIIVNTHSPTLWAFEGNYWLPNDVETLERDYFERKCVEYADFIVSPSKYIINWMIERNWTTLEKEKILVIPNLLNREYFAKLEKKFSSKVKVIKRLIYFGRIEPRKGVELFKKALLLLPEHQLKKIEEIIFLGKLIRTDEFNSYEWLKDFLRDIKEKHPEVHLKVYDFLRPQAIEFLSEIKDGLVVIPSLIENSPYTVWETLHLGIPFLASNVGGIPEMIDPLDRNYVLFDPIPQSLATKLSDVIENGFQKISSPAVDLEKVEDMWVNLFLEVKKNSSIRKKFMTFFEVKEYPLISVCLTHYERPNLLEKALKSLYTQTYPKYEIILVDDGSKTQQAKDFLLSLEKVFKNKNWKIIYQENRYLGAARNRAAKEAKGELLLFFDDDNVAAPNMLEIFVNAYLNTKADIYTCPNIHFFEDKDLFKSKHIWLPAGNCIASGIYINPFGDATSLIKKDVFKALGGFSEDYGLGYEDWEFFLKASLQGYKIEIIPEPLYYYRVSSTSMLRTVSHKSSNIRRLRPLMFLDNTGLGIGIAFGSKLYEEFHKQDLNFKDPKRFFDDDYIQAKDIFINLWEKKWFKFLVKNIIKILKPFIKK